MRLIEGPLAGAMTPIFQTSANRSGGARAPRSFEEIDERCSPPPTWRSTAGS